MGEQFYIDHAASINYFVNAFCTVLFIIVLICTLVYFSIGVREDLD